MARISDCIMSLTTCEVEMAASTPGPPGEVVAGEARVDMDAVRGGEPRMLRLPFPPFCRVQVMPYRKRT